ncbi:Uncharacterised protein [uncultured archaeon]|nr:Uncharacterised protein [uncultured archaeon]
MPAQSPTLSPTLSAITPGFRGSSSGIPASTFPTRSVPTSAAFVNMPPPILAKRLISDAPKPKPITFSTAVLSPPNMMNNPLTPRRARLATDIPVTAPPLNATSRAFFIPSFAALAQRTLLRTEMFIPRYPAAADIKAPRTNPIAVSILMATPIIIASTTAINATVLYCLFRYAIAPSCMAEAMAFIFSVPASSFIMYETRYTAKTSPIIPASGAEYNNGSIISSCDCSAQ